MACGDANPEDVEALFPAGSAPENRVDAISSLCSFGMRPHAMTGFLRQLLMQHYADPENIEDAVQRTRFREVGGWRATEQTGIYIESVTRGRSELTEKRPAILIKRNAWRWDRVTIGGQAGADALEGIQYFHGFWYGSHTVFAIAGNPAEAELLGTETLGTLLRYSPLITEQMGLHRFIPVEIGELAVVEESTKNYAVPLSFAYVAEENWQLETHAPRLKRFTFRRSGLL